MAALIKKMRAKFKVTPCCVTAEDSASQRALADLKMKMLQLYLARLPSGLEIAHQGRRRLCMHAAHLAAHGVS